LPALWQPSEKFVDLARRPVGHMGDPAGHTEPRGGHMTGVVIVAPLPVGVTTDRGPLGGHRGDLPPAGGGWAGPGPRVPCALGSDQRPLQCTHPAHGAADHARPEIDTKGIDEGLFGAYGVPDGQPRKTTAPGTPVRPRGGRSRTSLAAT